MLKQQHKMEKEVIEFLSKLIRYQFDATDDIDEWKKCVKAASAISNLELKEEMISDAHTEKGGSTPYKEFRLKFLID